MPHAYTEEQLVEQPGMVKTDLNESVWRAGQAAITTVTSRRTGAPTPSGVAGSGAVEGLASMGLHGCKNVAKAGDSSVYGLISK